MIAAMHGISVELGPGIKVGGTYMSKSVGDHPIAFCSTLSFHLPCEHAGFLSAPPYSISKSSI